MKFLRTTVVVATLVTLATVVPASASSPPTFHAAKKVALPAGAQGLPQGYLPTLSCVSPGNCEAGGDYTLGAGARGLVLNETNGVWTAPVTLKAPADAAPGSGVTIYGLSCGALGNCAAVGSYDDRAGNIQSFVATQVRKKWSIATKVTLPANALRVGQNSLVRSVDCPSLGNCSTVGDYQDNNALASHNVGFVMSEVHGRWQRAKEVTTVAAANLNPFITMNQIDCTSSANCVAVGSFVDANDVTQGLLVREVRGTWTRGVTLALPTNASQYAGAGVSEVTCVKNAACTVLGTYIATTGAVEALSAQESGGAWSRAIELTMPANAGINPQVFLYGFMGVACATSGTCSAGGQYRDAAGHYQGFIANEANGTWTSVVELSLPAGGASAGKNGGVIALTCPSAGNCRAGAAYLDEAGQYQALLVSEVDGTWLPGAKVVLPGGATTVGVDGGLYSLVCLTTSSCTGTGSYLTNATTYEGFTVAS